MDNLMLPELVQDILNDFLMKAQVVPEITKIILYGSYAQNRWNNESDIDIAVFVKESENNREDLGKDVLRESYKKLSAFCYDYPMDVQLQIFYESELANPMGIIEEIVYYGVDITT